MTGNLRARVERLERIHTPSLDVATAILQARNPGTLPAPQTKAELEHIVAAEPSGSWLSRIALARLRVWPSLQETQAPARA